VFAICVCCQKKAYIKNWPEIKANPCLFPKSGSPWPVLVVVFDRTQNLFRTPGILLVDSPSPPPQFQESRNNSGILLVELPSPAQLGIQQSPVFLSEPLPLRWHYIYQHSRSSWLNGALNEKKLLQQMCLKHYDMPFIFHVFFCTTTFIFSFNLWPHT
jgi:hypothetical protein